MALSLKLLFPLLFSSLLTALVWHHIFPSLVLVGNVTKDEVDGAVSLGGAVSYAAAVASSLGIRTCIITAADDTLDISWLRSNHLVHVIPSDSTLTFEHTYTFWGNNRKLRVKAQPSMILSASHVPWRCRFANGLLLGPLTQNDIDVESFNNFSLLWGGKPKHIGLMAQGLQRIVDPTTGQVSQLDEPSKSLLAGLGPRTSLFLSDIETDSWRNGTVVKVAQQADRILITRGRHGADEHVKLKVHRRPPFPIDRVVDTNGAGDCFATGYSIALAAGHDSPSEVANWAGAIAVSQPQHCKPYCVADAIKERKQLMPKSSKDFLTTAVSRLMELVPTAATIGLLLPVHKLLKPTMAYLHRVLLTAAGSGGAGVPSSVKKMD